MTTRRGPSPARLLARARNILPGGVNSPVRAFTAVGGDPLFIRSARGSRLEDTDGRTFIDYVMAWGSLLHGHAPGGLVDVLKAAARRGTSFGAVTGAEVELGEKIRALVPSVERVRFVNSGTEATMSAIRLARAATGRDRIITFEGGYHGHADPFLARAGSGATLAGVPTSPGVPRKAVTDTLPATYNDVPSCERICEAYRHQVAAIVVEPVAANMGVVLPADGFLAGLRALCDRDGILLVFDEVTTGFRIAAGGAQQVWQVRPDLTCLGNIIGGGLPVGAFGGRADLMDHVSPAGPVYQAGTLSGNPLVMAAGVWALEGLSRRFYQRLARLGTMLAVGLADAARQAGVALQVNAHGSMLAPFFTGSAVRDYRSALQSNSTQYAAFFHGMLARGVYPPPSQFETWFLSAAHTASDVRATIRAARDAMQEARQVA